MPLASCLQVEQGWLSQRSDRAPSFRGAIVCFLRPRLNPPLQPASPVPAVQEKVPACQPTRRSRWRHAWLGPPSTTWTLYPSCTASAALRGALGQPEAVTVALSSRQALCSYCLSRMMPDGQGTMVYKNPHAPLGPARRPRNQVWPASFRR